MRGLGYIEDPKQAKPDWGFADRKGLAASPASITNLSPQLGYPFDQGEMNSCVAQSVAKLVLASHRRQGIQNPEDLSRLAVWYLCRACLGNELRNVGTSIRTALDMLNRFGFAAEKYWPYATTEEDGRFKQLPPTRLLQRSHDLRRGTEFRRIKTTGEDRVRDVQLALTSGLPVAFGVSVSDDFASGKLDFSKPIDGPGPGDKIAGGHAMVIGGHTGRTFYVLNSWGSDWGNAGWWTMSVSYLMEARDLWVVDQAALYPLGSL